MLADPLTGFRVLLVFSVVTFPVSHAVPVKFAVSVHAIFGNRSYYQDLRAIHKDHASIQVSLWKTDKTLSSITSVLEMMGPDGQMTLNARSWMQPVRVSTSKTK